MRENMIEEEKNQFAVLIDADNISPKYAPIIFQELEAYGFPSCRRIYGNWSKANGWNEELLLEYSRPPQGASGISPALISASNRVVFSGTWIT